MSLSDLVRDGIISYEEAIAHSVYPDEVEKPRPAPVAMPASPINSRRVTTTQI